MAERVVGHLRIENALMEAIITAPLNGAQVKIVLAVFRLTVGWQRQTVKLTLEQLAQYCGYTASGGFREQRKELLDAGVLEFTADGAGRGASGSYLLVMDPSRWGQFTPAPNELARIWGARPEHSDLQLPLRIMTVEAGGHQESDKVPVNRQATDESLPVKGQATRLNTGRQHASIQAGKGQSSPAAAASSEAGKTLKDTKDNYPARLGRGDAMQLLTAIEALKERVGNDRKEVIRRDRIREQLGDDVDAAVRLIGGVDRLLKTRPEHRGILIGDLVIAMNRVRGHDAKAAIA